MKNYKVLVLNADMTPMHLMPLSEISWQDAIVHIMEGKATALEYYDAEIRTPSTTYKVPKVIVLRKYQYFKRKAALTKHNVKVRDNFTCQYCGKKHSAGSLTIDHVLPKSKGGGNSWENFVAACKPCNQNKKNNEKIVPKNRPYRPTYYELAKKLFKHKGSTNADWVKYLGNFIK